MDIIWEELTAGLPDARRPRTCDPAHRRDHPRGGRRIRAGAREETGGTAHPHAGHGRHHRLHPGMLGCGMSADGLSRVVQGLVTGIGFIGAGSILKVTDRGDVHGLTTAASVWMTAAIGVAVGLGALGVAMLSTVAAFIILSLSKHSLMGSGAGHGHDSAEES